MEFLECVSSRRSVRKYRSDSVADELLEKIVKAASYAPSWKNTQTTRYIAVKDSALKDYIADNCVMGFVPNQKTIHNAPAVILVTTVASRSGFERDGSYSTKKGTHWESFDAGIATQTLCLAAFNEGLATVIMGIFDEEKLSLKIKIPEGQRLSAIVAVGLSDELPDMPRRKGTEYLLTIL